MYDTTTMIATTGMGNIISGFVPGTAITTMTKLLWTVKTETFRMTQLECGIFLQAPSPASPPQV
jgi:hypothetical protein